MSNAAKKSVTYLGPENEAEASDYIVVNRVRLPRNVEVAVDAETAKLIEAGYKGHKFKVGSKADDSVPEARPTVTTPDQPEGGATGADAAEQEA